MRVVKISTIIVFVTIIILPALQMKFNFFSIKNLDENRNKQNAPTLSVSSLINASYFKDLEKYYNDNFGFRDLFIKLNTKVDMNVFKISPNPKVIIGKNDYLYYSLDLNDFHKENVLKNEQIQTTVKKIRKIQDMLKEKNITFLFLIGPNKSSIYPEFMPNKSKNPNSLSNYDLLMKELEVQGVNFLDLKPVLESKKTEYDLYYKRDTHWNETSGVIVTNEILNKFSNSFKTLGRPEITSFSKSVGGGYDLNLMLGLDRLTKTEYKKPIVNYGDLSLKLPNILWYHDSFGQALFPYMDQYSNKMIKFHYGENPISKTLLDNLTDTKIVIFEMVEREIPILVNYDFNIFNDSNEEVMKNHKEIIVDLPNKFASYDLNLQDTTNGKLKFDTTGTDSRLFWNVESAAVDYAYIEFTNPPQNATAQIFWTTDKESNYSEERSKIITLNPSKKNYLVKIGDGVNIKELRFDPSTNSNMHFEIESIRLYSK